MDFNYILANESQKSLAKEFAEKQGIRFENNTDATLLFFDGKEIIGTSSFKGKIIKGVAVREDYRGMGLGKQFVHRIIELQRRENIFHSLIFTSPHAASSFQGMGFHEVCRAEPWVAFLEYGFESFDSYLENIIDQVKEKPDFETAFVIHEYINKRQYDLLLNFSNKSPLLLFLNTKLFNRHSDKGFNDLFQNKNIMVIDGKNYIFPYKFLPTYFMKKPSIESFQAWASLDSKVFCKISKALEIQNRVLWSDQISYNKIVIPLLEKTNLKTSKAWVGC